MNKIKILDCTLRDGGYYNEWDFKDDLVFDLVTSISESGIDIIEMGYKSTVKEGFYGLYRYCSESQLQYLKDYSNVEFAFMIDTKEFLSENNMVDLKSINETILPSQESVFKWCRVATYYNTACQTGLIVDHLQKKGYKIAFNLMGLSLLTKEQIIEVLNIVNKVPVKVFYFADSFGSFTPIDIAKNYDLIRNTYNGPIGIHTHDNQGLAFANTIAALEAGIDYIDATVGGMGRGAGNLKLEQFLLALYFKYQQKEYNAFAILDLIQDHFASLQAQYQWGWDFSYMLSGLKNIHPTYCQKLKSNHQYTMAQVAKILSEIPDQYRSKYDSSILIETSSQILKPSLKQEEGNKLPSFQSTPSDEVLVIGTGPSIHHYENAVKSFVKKYHPAIIECNSTGLFNEFERIVAVLNQVRLGELKEKTLFNLNQAIEIVTGLETIPASLFANNLSMVNCVLHSGEFKLTNEQVILPSYVVGMFAIALALLKKPKVIYIAGFDGFSSAEKQDAHQEMQQFWNLLLQRGYLTDCKLISILPTHYDLQVQSVFSFLD